MTEEEVNEMKDHQLKGILEQLSATINEWDSQKCPAMKAHLDRTNPAEDEEETPEGVDSAAQEKKKKKKKMKLLKVKTEEMEKIQETKEMKEKQMKREEIMTMEMIQVKDLNLDLKQLLPPSL